MPVIRRSGPAAACATSCLGSRRKTMTLRRKLGPIKCKRFQEDKLRLLRAVRIATRFELAIEPATEAAIKEMAKELPIVSAERIAEELRQLLVHPRRTRGLDLLMDLGLADAILPELREM